MYNYPDLQKKLFLPLTTMAGDKLECQGYLVPNAEDRPFSYNFPLLQYICKSYCDAHGKYVLFVSVTSVDDSGVSVFFPADWSREQVGSKFDSVITYFISLKGRMPSFDEFSATMQKLGGLCRTLLNNIYRDLLTLLLR